jgi:hypothetical protein
MDLNKLDTSCFRENENLEMSEEARSLLNDMKTKIPALNMANTFINAVDESISSIEEGKILQQITDEAKKEGISLEQRLRKDKQVSDLIDQIGLMNPAVAKRAIQLELQRRRIAQSKIDGIKKPKSKEVLKRRAKNKMASKQRKR